MIARMSEREQQPPEGAFELDEPQEGAVREEMSEVVGEKEAERASSPEDEQEKIDAWVREKKAEAEQKMQEFIVDHERKKARIAALLNEPSVRDGALAGDVDYFLKAFDNLKRSHLQNKGLSLVVPDPLLEEDYQNFISKMDDFARRVHGGGRINPGREARPVSMIQSVRKIPTESERPPELWTMEAKKALGIS